jgi:serine/threonine-protein kinase RsbW
MCSDSKHHGHQTRVLKGTREAFDDVQDVILESMSALEYDEDALFAIRISLEEALANALLHGHSGEEAYEIEIAWLINDTFVECIITDQGRGYDPGSIPDPTADENLTLPSGRGLAMMRAFMDEVSVNEQGNCVTMKRNKART